MQEFREQGGLKGIPVPLISADGEVTIWFQPNHGKRTDIIFQFTNPILTGNTPGISTYFRVPWKRAMEFASGLGAKEGRSIANMLDQGQGVVPGFTYGPVQLDLNPLAYMRVFLNGDECRTIAHAITEAVKRATERPKR